MRPVVSHSPASIDAAVAIIFITPVDQPAAEVLLYGLGHLRPTGITSAISDHKEIKILLGQQSGA
jgi:hypothetical protein